MNDQDIPSVSLARLVQYTTRNCYKELQKLVENCLEEDCGTAKVLLYEFLLSQRYRFTRLSVLLKWYARYGKADEYCEEKITEARRLLALYESSADGLWTVHNKLSSACLPLIPIRGATEILATGGYSRLPSIIYRNFVNKEYLLGLEGGKETANIMQNNSDWLGLVSRTLLQSCLSKNKNLHIFCWKTSPDEQAVEVGNTRGGWSLVLMAAMTGDQCTGWKVLQVRIHIRSASLGVMTDRQNNQVAQSVLSKEQESYLRGLCQQLFDRHCSSEGESSFSISQAIAESGRFLEEKICIPLAMDILRLQAFRLSKNPLFVFKIQKDMDAVSLKFWEDPLSTSTEIRISALTDAKDEDLKDKDGSQQVVEYKNGSCFLVVRRWPFCIYMSLVDVRQKADFSKDSLLRQVVVNQQSTKILSKTIPEPLLDICIDKISIESIIFQLLAFKCRYLLERLKEELVSREIFQSDSSQIFLEYDENVHHVSESQAKVAHLKIQIIGNIIIRMQVSLISGKLCAYTYDGYAWLKDKRCSTGYTEFSPMDYSGVAQFIADHEKCIVRTSTYCQAKAVSLVVKDDYFTPRLPDEKLMNAICDKYALSCYTDLDTCIALSPIGWFGTDETKNSRRSEGYEFYCETLTPYNLFFVYHKEFDSKWLLTHSLNACLVARWLAIIETRKRQRELESILEAIPLESSVQQRFQSNQKCHCHNGLSYVVEESSMRNVQFVRIFSMPVEKVVFYTNSSGVRRIWFDFAFSFLDQGDSFSYRRLVRRFSYVSWLENEGIRLWHFGGQNLKASLILTYAHGHICLRRLTGDILIAQQMSKLIRSISSYQSQFIELIWKNWRELVVINKPLNVTWSSTNTGQQKHLPPVYIRIDLRRPHNSRWLVSEDLKEEGKTYADSKMNNRMNPQESKAKRYHRNSLQSIQQESPSLTIQIFPLTSYTKEVCELMEEILALSSSHVHHYLDVILDHICFLVECLMLLGARFLISWLTLFRLEISLPIMKEKDRILFCCVELSCEESPKTILFKNLGHYMKSTNVGPETSSISRNKDRAISASGRIPFSGNRVSELWNALQHIVSSSKNELYVTTHNNDQIILKKEDLPIIFERLVRFFEQNKPTSNAVWRNNR